MTGAIITENAQTLTAAIKNGSGTVIGDSSLVASLVHGATYTLDISGALAKFTMPTDTTVTQTALGTTATTNYYLLASGSYSHTSGAASTANYSTSAKLNGKGELTAYSFYATSDRRLKENIKEFKPQKSILDLPVVEFDFKESGSHQIGCIAQDLQEICPEIVNTDAEGYLSINENKIVYLLLDEVKKLKEEVKQLRTNKN